ERLPQPVRASAGSPDGESREFHLAKAGNPMWRIPGILLDRKQMDSVPGLMGAPLFSLESP
ncbi:MAG: hypothetical protein ACLQMF_11925, partial [Rectinemataceae bacterium]